MPHEFSICSDPGWVPGMQVAFKFELKGDEDAKELGLLAMHVMEQCRAKQELVEALVEHAALTETVERYQELVEGLTQKRLEGRTSLIADMEQEDKIRHLKNPRRAEWAPNTQQQQQVAAWDLETRKQLRALELQKIEAEKKLPMFLPQIARQRAILAGADRADVIPFKAVAEAAD